MNHNFLTINKGRSKHSILVCVAVAVSGLSLTPRVVCASDDTPAAIRAKTPPAPANRDQVEEFTQIIDLKLKSEFALAYIGRGDAYRRRGEMDAAIADYNKAI